VQKITIAGCVETVQERESGRVQASTRDDKEGGGRRKRVKKGTVLFIVTQLYISNHTCITSNRWTPTLFRPPTVPNTHGQPFRPI
jgi:hypothetical protein